MEEVLITIKGKSYANGQDADITELLAVGTLSCNEDSLSLTYDDSMGMGVKGVTAILKAYNGGMVTIERTGVLEHKLMVEKDKRHLCLYKTPYGDMTLGVFGEEVKNNLTKDGGKLFMRYSLDINLGLISENEIEIDVKAAKKDVGIS